MNFINRIIWDEYVQSKSWEQYISEYIGRKMDWRKWFNVSAVLCAVFGGSTWALWKTLDAEWVTPLIFGFLAISQVLSAIQKDVIVNTDTLQSLMKLRTMYINYSNNLEQLYLEVLSENATDDELKKKYFEIKKIVSSIEELKDSLNIKPLKKLDYKVNSRVSDFLKARYGVS